MAVAMMLLLNEVLIRDVWTLWAVFSVGFS